MIYRLLYPPMLLEFTATHSSESIKQLAAGVSGFFSEQLLWSTAPEKGAETHHAGLKGPGKRSNVLYFLFSLVWQSQRCKNTDSHENAMKQVIKIIEMMSFFLVFVTNQQAGVIYETKTASITKKNNLPLISQSTCLISQLQRLSERSDRNLSICSSAALSLLLGPQVNTTNMERSRSSWLQTMVSFKPYMISQHIIPFQSWWRWAFVQ